MTIDIRDEKYKQLFQELGDKTHVDVYRKDHPFNHIRETSEMYKKAFLDDPVITLNNLTNDSVDLKSLREHQYKRYLEILEDDKKNFSEERMKQELEDVLKKNTLKKALFRFIKYNEQLLSFDDEFNNDILNQIENAKGKHELGLSENDMTMLARGELIHRIFLPYIKAELTKRGIYEDIMRSTTMDKMNGRLYDYFVKGDAEFDMFNEIEPKSHLSAQEAVATYNELQTAGTGCVIGINIPGDIVFDDPDSEGASILTRENGTDSFRMGDTFITQLKEDNEHGRNVIAAYKELYQAAADAGLTVERPAFVWDKEAELQIEYREITPKPFNIFRENKSDVFMDFFNQNKEKNDEPNITKEQAEIILKYVYFEDYKFYATEKGNLYIYDASEDFTGAGESIGNKGVLEYANSLMQKAEDLEYSIFDAADKEKLSNVNRYYFPETDIEPSLAENNKKGMSIEDIESSQKEIIVSLHPQQKPATVIRTTLSHAWNDFCNNMPSHLLGELSLEEYAQTKDFDAFNLLCDWYGDDLHHCNVTVREDGEIERDFVTRAYLAQKNHHNEINVSTFTDECLYKDADDEKAIKIIADEQLSYNETVSQTARSVADFLSFPTDYKLNGYTDSSMNLMLSFDDRYHEIKKMQDGSSEKIIALSSLFSDCTKKIHEMSPAKAYTTLYTFTNQDTQEKYLAFGPDEDFAWNSLHNSGARYNLPEIRDANFTCNEEVNEFSDNDSHNIRNFNYSYNETINASKEYNNAYVEAQWCLLSERYSTKYEDRAIRPSSKYLNVQSLGYAQAYKDILLSRGYTKEMFENIELKLLPKSLLEGKYTDEQIKAHRIYTESGRECNAIDIIRTINDDTFSYFNEDMKKLNRDKFCEGILEAEESLESEKTVDTTHAKTQEDVLTPEILELAKSVLPENQYTLVEELSRGEEKAFYIEKLRKIADAVKNAPSIYATDGQAEHPVLFRYFSGNTTVYACELDIANDEYYGYTVLNRDTQLAEWGYGSLSELKHLPSIEMDFYLEDGISVERKRELDYPELAQNEKEADAIMESLENYRAYRDTETGNYFLIQTSDESGFDYTVYDKNYKEIDGGVAYSDDDPESEKALYNNLPITIAAQQVIKNNDNLNIKFERCEEVDYETIEEAVSNAEDQAIETLIESRHEENATAFVLDKLHDAGIEIIDDKNQFDNILASKTLLQKMAGEYAGGYLTPDGDVKWNTIDYTQRAWLELNINGNKVYLERSDDRAPDYRLAVDTSFPDLESEYNYDERAVNKHVLHFATERERDSFVTEHYIFAADQIVQMYFSFTQKEADDFNRQIDQWEKDSSNPKKLIYIGKIPPVMKAVGIPERPIEMEPSVITKVLRSEPIYAGDKHGHNLSLDDIRSIPQQLANPVMIFKSRTRSDSYVFFTDKKDNKNRSILISMTVNKKYGRLVINEITSMYGRTNEIGYVYSNIAYNNLVYIDKKRSVKWEQMIPVEDKKISPEGKLESQKQYLRQRSTMLSGLPYNITTKENLVKFISARHLMVRDNTVYGFAHEGKIYLNPDVMNSNVAMHEYTHLWDAYIQNTNPELWGKGKNILKKTHLWDEVKNDPNYADIAHDDNLVLSECHARIIGDMAQKVLERIAKEDGKIAKDKVIDWDKEVDDYLHTQFSQESLLTDVDLNNLMNNVFPSLSDEIKPFLQQPMKDLMSGRNINLEKVVEKVNEKEGVKEDYHFTPTVDENGYIDYTGVEPDKIFLANKKDILNRGLPSYLPPIKVQRGLHYDIPAVKINENEYLISGMETVDKIREIAHKEHRRLSAEEVKECAKTSTIYKVSLDVYAALLHYHLEYDRAAYKMIAKTNEAARKRALELGGSGYTGISTKLPDVPCALSSDVLVSKDVVFNSWSKNKEIKPERVALKGANIRTMFMVNYGFISAFVPGPNVYKHHVECITAVRQKMLDMEMEKADYESTWAKGKETSYGASNTDKSLLDAYGVLVKRQNGDMISSYEKKQLQTVLDDVYSVYGNLSLTAKDFNLVVSHAGDKRQHASKAVGMFLPCRSAIGISFQDGDFNASGTGCHEFAHFLDHLMGKKEHYWHSSDKQGTLSHKIADTFRTNMIPMDGEYWNRTCECFARAMEENAKIELLKKKNPSITREEIDTIVSAPAYMKFDDFENKIKPMVNELLVQYKKELLLEKSPTVEAVEVVNSNNMVPREKATATVTHSTSEQKKSDEKIEAAAELEKDKTAATKGAAPEKKTVTAMPLELFEAEVTKPAFKVAALKQELEHNHITDMYRHFSNATAGKDDATMRKIVEKYSPCKEIQDIYFELKHKERANSDFQKSHPNLSSTEFYKLATDEITNGYLSLIHQQDPGYTIPDSKEAELPFEIVKNSENNHIQIRFDPYRKNKDFKAIISELKEEGWQFAGVAKCWYPRHSAVKNCISFAEKLQKKYTHTGKENQTEHRSIAFFDYAYNGAEELQKYFNTHKSASLRNLSLDEAKSVISNFVPKKLYSGVQKTVRVGVDSDDNLIIFVKENESMSVQNVSQQNLLKFSYTIAVENRKESEQFLKEFDKQPKNGAFADSIRTIYQTNLNLSQKIEDEMAAICKEHIAPENKLRQLPAGYSIGSFVIKDSVALSNGVHQTTLTHADGSEVNHFVLEDKIAAKCDPSVIDLTQQYDTLFLVENKRYEPYVINELISKKLCEPESVQYQKQLTTYLEKHPLKYAKLDVNTVGNFKENLRLLTEIEKSKDVLALGKQLVSMADTANKKEISAWLKKEGCVNEKTMKDVFSTWCNEPSQQQKLKKEPEVQR